MSALLGVVCYEYHMAIRRWGMWLAFALAGAPLFISLQVQAPGPNASEPIWQAAGTLAVSLNFWMPVVGGIVIADRLVRDQHLGVRELLASTPLSRRGYVLGKYAGVVLATLTPVLTVLLLLATLAWVQGVLPALIPAVLVAFLAINVPTYLFVGAFSLACPVALPVRVYQVLYTGYWFWGNFINPKFIPSVSDTLLNATGKFAAGAFFRAGLSRPVESLPPNAVAEATANIAVLVACAAVALLALMRYLAWQERRA